MPIQEQYEPGRYQSGTMIMQQRQPIHQEQLMLIKSGGQAVLGRQNILPTPWLTERHGYDPTWVNA